MLIIHELCHAVTICGHDRKWQNRMLEASQLARQMGKTYLGSLIEENVKGYIRDIEDIKIGKVSSPHEEVYGRIEDALLDVPEASLDQIVEWLRHDYAMSTEEFHKCYKRCKQVYDKAKKRNQILGIAGEIH